MTPMARARVILLLGLSVLLVSRGSLAGPADDLLRRVPPGAGLAIVVEDLREHVREWLRSPLAEDLNQLSEQGGWPGDDALRKLAIARREIEIALNVDLATIRDALLGDAVVLSLHVEPGAPPEDARGLFLIRAKDQNLLNRFVDRINAADRLSGQLTRLDDRSHSGQPYLARLFEKDQRPTEFYVIFEDGTFAWSNFEPLIQGVIERQGKGPPGLGSEPRFLEVRQALPESSVLSLYVDPAFVKDVLKADPGTPSESDLPPLLVDYLKAIRYAGCALEWRDGPVLHLHELIDPDQLEAPLRNLPARSGATAHRIDRVPASALAIVVGQLDLVSLYDVVLPLITESDPTKADLLETALEGLLLGLDLRSEILPKVGPGMVGFIDTPRPDDPIIAWPPMVLALSIEAESVAEALNNALRTFLAFIALDEKNVRDGNAPSLKTTDLPGGGHLTTLIFGAKKDKARLEFAFAFQGGQFLIGTQVEAVANFLANETPVEKSDLLRWRDHAFPEQESFAIVDLQAVHQLADAHREELAQALAARRGAADVAATQVDLDRILALAGLFRVAFVTSKIAPDFTSAHRTFGLIARDAERPTLP